MQTIAHIYTRGLLTTFEKRFSPVLDNQPLIILNNNKVMDYCPRAKNKGISPGMLKRHVSYNLPEAVFLKYSTEKYKTLSAELLKGLSNYTPRAEALNEQEFFIDLTGEKTPELIINKVANWFVPAYCNSLLLTVAKTKLTARASSLAVTTLPKNFWQPYVKIKKTGNIFLAALPNEEKEFWPKLPVNLLWPLDEKIIKRLQELGLATCKQIQELPVDELASHFGCQASLIHRFSSGLDYSHVQVIRTPGRLSKKFYLDNCSDRLRIIQLLEEASLSLAAQLAVTLEGFRELVLTIEDEAGKFYTESRKFNRILHTPSAVKTNLLFLLDLLKPSIPVRGMTIYLKGINPVPTKQLEIFEARLPKPDLEQQKKLAEVISNLNRKFPSRLVSLGKNITLSRREQMLQFWDPLRFIDNEVKVNGQAH